MIRRCRFDAPPREVTVADLTRTMLPERFWRVSIDAIVPEADFLPRVKLEVTGEGLRTLTSEGAGRLFLGDANSGKTSLAALYAKAVVAHRGSALFLPVRDLRRVWFDNPPPRIPAAREDERATIRERLATVTLLILDDLGAVSFKSESASMEVLEAVLRDRYDAKGSVIVTTNLSPKALTEKFPASVMSILDRLVLPVKVQNGQWKTLREAQ